MKEGGVRNLAHTIREKRADVMDLLKEIEVLLGAFLLGKRGMLAYTPRRLDPSISLRFIMRAKREMTWPIVPPLHTNFTH